MKTPSSGRTTLPVVGPPDSATNWTSLKAWGGGFVGGEINEVNSNVDTEDNVMGCAHPKFDETICHR